MGALLLLITPQRTFVALVPSILLVATLLSIFRKPLAGLVRARFSLAGRRPWVGLIGVACLQLIIEIYGGYCGGASAFLYSPPWRSSRCMMSVGAAQLALTTGPLICIPAGVDHAVANEGPEPVEILTIFTRPRL